MSGRGLQGMRLPFYFVIDRESGNVIRLIRRESVPDDTPTIIHLLAPCSGQRRHASLYASGRDLIHASHVLDDFDSACLRRRVAR
ncbi:hypothetical protein thsps21_40560 [Pseudomonas sp. No.21]|nr:hypothetical protein TUM20249_35150 [Pseudomonas tohonis]